MTKHYMRAAGLLLAAGGILAASGGIAPARQATPTPAAPAAGNPNELPAGQPAPSRTFESRRPPATTEIRQLPGGFNPPGRPAGPETEEMRRLREEAAEAERTVESLLAPLAAAGEVGKESEKESAKAKVKEALAAQFEARQRYRDLEIRELEAEVARLRELHRRREGAKSEIVEARLGQLVRSAEGLGWDGTADGLTRPGFGSPFSEEPGFGSPFGGARPMSMSPLRAR